MGNFKMRLEDILIDEQCDIKTAVERLENVRCKVVYVVEGGKLKASVSDGDIRRYVLKSGDFSRPVREIANYKPNAFLNGQKEEIERFFKRTETFSVPIINYNHEIIAIVFRNGNRIERESRVACPVVMMAGGKGTRLYPYTKILPKALIPVGELPISEMIFQRFRKYGCQDFFMIVNHKKNMIQAYFDGIEKDYRVTYMEEERPLGTGGGLYLLKGKIKEDFFLVNCDIVIDADYAEIIDYHKRQKNYITIVAARYSYTVPYGVVFCDEEHKYRGMREKPSQEYLINTGMYVVSRQMLEWMPERENISFPELIQKAEKKEKRIGVYCVDESAYMDMGQIEELESMRKKLSL